MKKNVIINQNSFSSASEQGITRHIMTEQQNSSQTTSQQTFTC